ncbi:hypothetical protein A3F58_00555 [Candidatus Roizmanbacteria bacterium RIFCSPHIGHO2_12_FULL_37_9b]|uniref:Cohesin domain-containing protein n=1 Tax=Candidatus Roizmanbacteria bacterium RIFCSPHIGHO2_02_FULL_38_11 TaxID=1802039 RepID=A0A1F7GW15_9BACT|nr:MAG: hypothetical protein A3C25_01230 [Candidatus Roizmanbacteria bacterium RIFCSPHIGHO2_02_FULL_38_11]OGK33900.1 MAG: hypothetical protein A3F58_00555 [Candidatus Roizmanbacteria bacterium RIFCSPHIGHO2_12_FULL_37_9b]
MKQFLFGIFLILTTYFLSASVFGQAHGAFFNFDNASFSANTGETFDAQVIVDAGSDQITSTDAYIVYDVSLLEAQIVTPGSFFPTVINNITSGKVYIAGLVDDPATYQTGSGTVATITFKALAQGSGTLSFDCQPDVYNSSKIIKNDINATNVIVCSENGTASVAVGGGGTGLTVTPSNFRGTITPSALPRAGVLENVNRVVVPGMILLLIGGALRIIL